MKKLSLLAMVLLLGIFACAQSDFKEKTVFKILTKTLSPSGETEGAVRL